MLRVYQRHLDAQNTRTIIFSERIKLLSFNRPTAVTYHKGQQVSFTFRNTLPPPPRPSPRPRCSPPLYPSLRPLHSPLSRLPRCSPRPPTPGTPGSPRPHHHDHFPSTHRANGLPARPAAILDALACTSGHTHRGGRPFHDKIYTCKKTTL